MNLYVWMMRMNRISLIDPSEWLRKNITMLCMEINQNNIKLLYCVNFQLESTLGPSQPCHILETETTVLYKCTPANNQVSQVSQVI